MSREQLDAIVEALRAQAELVPDEVDALRSFYEAISEARPIPAGVLVESVDVAGIPGAWYRPAGVETKRTVLYFHGGGYVIGSLKTHASLMGQLALSARANVLGVEYRLAPEHPHPAAIEDARKAFDWLIASGCAIGDIAIAGDSAGGGLTLALLVQLLDDGVVLPKAGVCFSPWTDMACTGDSLVDRAALDPFVDLSGLEGMAQMFIGDGNAQDPLASPMYADLEGLPPLLIQVGTAEILLDDATRVAACAQVAGVDVTLEIWDDMFHVWQIFSEILDEAMEAMEKAGRFIQKHTTLDEAGKV